MTAATEAAPAKGMGTLMAVLAGGLIAGIIDIGAAALITGKDPVFICRIIAGGLMGKAALAGDTSVVLLGFGLQLAMGVLIAAIYGVATRLLPMLGRSWIV